MHVHNKSFWCLYVVCTHSLAYLWYGTYYYLSIALLLLPSRYRALKGHLIIIVVSVFCGGGGSVNALNTPA